MSKRVIIAVTLLLLMLLTSCSSAESYNNKGKDLLEKVNTKRQ